MTIGTGAFYPSGRFVTPRSYVAKIVNHSAGFTLTQAANVFTLDFRPTYPSVYHWTFHPNFWAWSSNCWSLDHIITESYYVQTPDPTQIPLNFGLYWVRYAPDFLPQIQFAPNLSTVMPVTASFPSYPLDYWARPT